MMHCPSSEMDQLVLLVVISLMLLVVISFIKCVYLTQGNPEQKHHYRGPRPPRGQLWMQPSSP